jgi:transposase
MHIDRISSHQGSHVSYLLRQSYRDQGKVKHRTLANLTPLPMAAIDAIRAVLKGRPVGDLEEAFEVLSSKPHGHVLAVLGTLRRLGLDRVLAVRPQRERELVVAMVVRQVIRPSSKLATARSWQSTTLGSLLGVEDADEDDLYAALDWLGQQQMQVEAQLASRHLHNGSLVLYDLTSVVVEGRHCPLARRGYSRDGKKGTLQVEFGILADWEGRPVAVEAFAGNTSDPKTVAAQVEKLQQRFGLEQLVLVGDRGMLTSARIDALKKLKGIDWVSALKGVQIRALVDDGELQLGLFDHQNLAEMVSPKFPGERLVVCKNSDLARERARTREDLLSATERELEKVATSVRAGRLKGQDKIGVRVGKVLNRYKVGKHFAVEITEQSFSYSRLQENIAREAALDGIYAIRSSLRPEHSSPQELVRIYKLLARVERAYRTLKSVDLRVRPLRHRLEDRVRAHIFLCTLAYYVRWHMERALAPLLFRDESPTVADDPVAPAQRSAAAEEKAQSHMLDDGTPAYDFSGLLDELSTLTRQQIRVGATTFLKVTTPTPLQQRAFSLLGVPITV